jgi:hypothetical protein
MSFKIFANLNELDEDDLNDYLMRQVVARFADAAARSAAIATPDLGMLSFLEDTETYEWFDGAAWAPWAPPLMPLPVHATVDRPAATIGAGHAYFDSTLGYPLWSNGTDWVDASGTVS